MQATNCVEFIGGPFDGHAQSVSLQARQLAAVAILPVSRTVYRLLAGKAELRATPVTSLAEYRLELAGDQIRYHFVRALSPATRRIAS